jgi:hypothetical protein
MSMNYGNVGTPVIQKAPIQAVTALTTGNSGWTLWGKSEALVEVSGTFNNATATLYARHKDRTSVEIQVTDLTGVPYSLTANGIVYVRLPSNYELQLRTTSGGPSQSLNMYIN